MVFCIRLFLHQGKEDILLFYSRKFIDLTFMFWFMIHLDLFFFSFLSMLQGRCQSLSNFFYIEIQ